MARWDGEEGLVSIYLVPIADSDKCRCGGVMERSSRGTSKKDVRKEIKRRMFSRFSFTAFMNSLLVLPLLLLLLFLLLFLLLPLLLLLLQLFLSLLLLSLLKAKSYLFMFAARAEPYEFTGNEMK